MRFVKKQLRRLRFAIAGIRYAVRTDKNFRTLWYGLGTVVALALYFLFPLESSDLLFLLFSYTLILITELQNSALEYALDHLHPDAHENIGRSKDMAAGAVLLAGLFFFLVLGYLTISHLS
jgi:diacylglycerol kinase (ATP)